MLCDATSRSAKVSHLRVVDCRCTFLKHTRRLVSSRRSRRARAPKNLMRHRHNETIRLAIISVGTVHDNTEPSAPFRFFCKYSGSAKALWRGDNRAAGFRVEPRLVTRSKRYLRGLPGHVMSALGQKRTFAAQQPMSALPPIADIDRRRGMSALCQ